MHVWHLACVRGLGSLSVNACLPRCVHVYIDLHGARRVGHPACIGPCSTSFEVSFWQSIYIVQYWNVVQDCMLFNLARSFVSGGIWGGVCMGANPHKNTDVKGGCMYARVCVCMYVCTCVRFDVWLFLYICMGALCVCVFFLLCVSARMPGYPCMPLQSIYICICVYGCMYVCVRVYVM